MSEQTLCVICDGSGEVHNKKKNKKTGDYEWLIRECMICGGKGNYPTIIKGSDEQNARSLMIAIITSAVSDIIAVMPTNDALWPEYFDNLRMAYWFLSEENDLFKSYCEKLDLHVIRTLRQLRSVIQAGKMPDITPPEKKKKKKKKKNIDGELKVAA